MSNIYTFSEYPSELSHLRPSSLLITSALETKHGDEIVRIKPPLFQEFKQSSTKLDRFTMRLPRGVKIKSPFQDIATPCTTKKLPKGVVNEEYKLFSDIYSKINETFSKFETCLRPTKSLIPVSGNLYTVVYNKKFNQIDVYDISNGNPVSGGTEDPIKEALDNCYDEYPKIFVGSLEGPGKFKIILSSNYRKVRPKDPESCTVETYPITSDYSIASDILNVLSHEIDSILVVADPRITPTCKYGWGVITTDRAFTETIRHTSLDVVNKVLTATITTNTETVELQDIASFSFSENTRIVLTPYKSKPGYKYWLPKCISVEDRIEPMIFYCDVCDSPMGKYRQKIRCHNKQCAKLIKDFCAERNLPYVKELEEIVPVAKPEYFSEALNRATVKDPNTWYILNMIKELTLSSDE